MTSTITTLLAIVALLAPASASAGHRPPATTDQARAFGERIAFSLGGGQVARCEQRGRYNAACRVDLGIMPCWAMARVATSSGRLVRVLPDVVRCKDGKLMGVRIALH